MKILHLDIETYPQLAYVWGLFKQNIPINHIVEPGRTACWAAKWHGEDEVHFGAEWDDPDYIGRIWDLLYEADAVVHYNGSRFDMPTLNQEFLLAGGQAPAPYHDIDLLRTVRSNFRFASNKLDFVAQQLGIGQKVAHRGMDLWSGCMNGDEECHKEMEEYNIQDVMLLEDLYNVLLPWIKGHPNVNLYNGQGDLEACPHCGSTHLHKRGTTTTKVLAYQRYHCQDCFKWSRSKTNIGTSQLR